MEEWTIYNADNELSFTTPLPDDKILRHISKGARILDIACGYGRVLKYLREKSYVNLIGNDISRTLIAKAQQSIPDADFFVGDMTKFSTDEKFDLVLLMGAIEYILEDKGQKEFITLIGELLNKDSYLYLDSFVLDNIALLRQYMRGFLTHLHWGRFINSRGYDCHHSSIARLQSLVLEEFEIVVETRRKIRTWSGKLVNSYSLLARKKLKLRR